MIVAGVCGKYMQLTSHGACSSYVLGILFIAMNYELMYPVQPMVLILTWQLAKYIVSFC